MIEHNKKIIVFAILLIAGAALLSYGAFFNYKNVFPQDPQDTSPSSKSESAIIKDATVGGLKRELSGKIRLTYTGQAPDFCPT